MARNVVSRPASFDYAYRLPAETSDEEERHEGKLFRLALATLVSSGFSSLARADGMSLTNAKLHGDETIEAPVGPIQLNDSYFDDAASKRLYDEMDYQRAAQAYIWSTPLVSVTTWRDNQGKAYGVESATDFVVLESLKEKRASSPQT